MLEIARERKSKRHGMFRRVQFFHGLCFGVHSKHVHVRLLHRLKINSVRPPIDEIGIFVAFERKRPDAEHAVLGLQHHVDAVGDVVGDERRHADAEVDVVAVAQFLGHATRHLFTRQRHGSPSACD